MKHVFYTSILLVLVSFVSINAQELERIEGDKYFNQMKYYKAIDYYKASLAKKTSIEVLNKLGDCLRYTNQYEDAADRYAMVVLSPRATPEVFFHYGSVLKNLEKYDEAKAMFLKYAELAPDKARQGIMMANSCDEAQKLLDNPRTYIVNNLEAINTPYSEFCPSPLGDGLAFTSNRALTQKELDMDMNTWMDKSFFKIYKCESIKSPTPSITTLPDVINDRFHNGPASFSSNQNEVYFTKTRLDKSDKNKTNKLEIFFATKKGSTWSDAQAFAYNSPAYNVAHPVLSQDGNILVFCSDKSKGEGKMDLYISKKVDGKWQEPKNLGPTINTSGNELFPAFDPWGNLYFSSNGYGGLGGLDIYFSAKLTDSTWEAPTNMGSPVNSPKDDFGIYLLKDSTGGYFSSNRLGGKGEDDIYSFEYFTPPKPNYYLMVRAFERVNDQKVALKDVNFVVTNQDNKEKLLTFERDKQKWFLLAGEGPYSVTASKAGYFTQTSGFEKIELKYVDTVTLSLEMELELEMELQPIVLNKAVEVKNIYYDYNSAAIRPDAALELDKLYRLLNDNPELIIQMGSHTDSRGSDAYNMKLSQQRAESTVQYLIAQGVEANRLKAKGFGESDCLNRCVNNVNCSEEEYQINRRTEFRVIGFIPNTNIISAP